MTNNRRLIKMTLFAAILILLFQSQLRAASLGDVIARNWDTWSNGNDSVQKDDLLAATAWP